MPDITQGKCVAAVKKKLSKKLYDIFVGTFFQQESKINSWKVSDNDTKKEYDEYACLTAT